MNKRDPANMDILKFNTRDGSSEMVYENDNGYLSMISDNKW